MLYVLFREWEEFTNRRLSEINLLDKLTNPGAHATRTDATRMFNTVAYDPMYFLLWQYFFSAAII